MTAEGRRGASDDRLLQLSGFVYVKLRKKYDYQGSGLFLSRRWLLTARHNLETKKGRSLRGCSQVRVVRAVGRADDAYLKVCKIVGHPDPGLDLALVQLEDEIDLQPAQLLQLWRSDLKAGSTLHAHGMSGKSREPATIKAEIRGAQADGNVELAVDDFQGENPINPHGYSGSVLCYEENKQIYLYCLLNHYLHMPGDKRPLGARAYGIPLSPVERWIIETVGVNDQKLRERLDSHPHDYNEHFFISRGLEGKLINALRTGEPLVLYGPIQAGRWTLIEHIISEFSRQIEYPCTTIRVDLVGLEVCYDLRNIITIIGEKIVDYLHCDDANQWLKSWKDGPAAPAIRLTSLLDYLDSLGRKENKMILVVISNLDHIYFGEDSAGVFFDFGSIIKFFSNTLRTKNRKDYRVRLVIEAAFLPIMHYGVLSGFTTGAGSSPCVVEYFDSEQVKKFFNKYLLQYEPPDLKKAEALIAGCVGSLCQTAFSAWQERKGDLKSQLEHIEKDPKHIEAHYNEISRIINPRFPSERIRKVKNLLRIMASQEEPYHHKDDDELALLLHLVTCQFVKKSASSGFIIAYQLLRKIVKESP